MRRADRVKGPILVPFTLVLLLALGALLSIAYRYEAHARAHDLANSVRAVERLFRLQLDNDAAKLHATLCPISRDTALKAAFLAGDLGALQAQIAPLFERLRGNTGSPTSMSWIPPAGWCSGLTSPTCPVMPSTGPPRA
jgi:hypothetical protein